MPREKYVELRRKRFREREERFRRERERIRATKEKERALRLIRWIESVTRKKEAEEKREKAENALCEVKKAVKEIEGKVSSCIPEMMRKISETLADADNSYEAADYKKTLDLSNELAELLNKARLETSKRAEKQKERREEERKYLYCVVPCVEEKSLGHIGMNNDEVYTIPYRDIAAVVSDSPAKDYEMAEDNIRKHEVVLRQVMESHTVVPAEFGTTIRNERILRRLLTKAYEPTRECLRLVDNMVELGLKAVLSNDMAFDDQEKRKECISDIFGSLNTIAKQAVTGDIFSDRLVLNASFLVNKGDIETFSNEVTRLQEKYRMLKLLYSGPWPPYNFIYIKIGTEGIEISKSG